MGSVPVLFRKSGDEVINSYTLSDIISQVGYLKLYGVNAFGSIYGLTAYPLWSHDIGYTTTSWLAAAGADQLRFEKDFDATLATSQTIKGDLYVNVSIAVSGAANVTGYLKVRIYHYDGTTETEIGTQQSTSTEPLTSTAAAGKRYLLKFAVNRYFKAGEKLRLNIEAWASSLGNCTYYNLYHAGDGRSSGVNLLGTTISTPTTLEVLTPLRIDL